MACDCDIRHVGKIICWYGGCSASWILRANWTGWEDAASDIDHVFQEARDHIERHARSET